MAVHDSSVNEIVLRVVYDGPPEAGKTTSIRALASSLGQPSETPEENSEGRTQWFDWMEYVGGRFEGCQIRCQIVSVPGQRELGARRWKLLSSADVVVFVGDSSPARWPLTLEYLDELQHKLVGRGVGIVFQANKRDAAGAIGLSTIQRELGESRYHIGLVESIAADGTGIREAFVYAVRLALDRVREELVSGSLRADRPTQRTAGELLALLQSEENADTVVADVAPAAVPSTEEITVELPPVPSPIRRLTPPMGTSLVPSSVSEALRQALQAPRVADVKHSLAASLIEEVLAAEQAPALPPIPPLRKDVHEAPRPPDASVPSGAIWPPVEGRAILYEVSQLDLQPRRHANGDWSAGLGSGWRLVSSKDALFESLDGGRAALVQWARLHAACMSVVSAHRCIVLAATGDGMWRLWQIVRAEESLREIVDRTSAEEADDRVIGGLCQTAEHLVDVCERLAQAPCELPCSLDTIGALDASAVYIGLMPETAVPPRAEPIVPATLVVNELGPMIRLELAERRARLGHALKQAPRGGLHAEVAIASLARLLEQPTS